MQCINEKVMMGLSFLGRSDHKDAHRIYFVFYDIYTIFNVFLEVCTIF
jgi:hypothetical protein